MPDVTFTVSLTFLQRMRAAIVREQSGLAGQPNTVINEAARLKVRTLIRQWVHDSERSAAVADAVSTATASTPPPTDIDIT